MSTPTRPGRTTRSASAARLQRTRVRVGAATYRLAMAAEARRARLRRRVVDVDGLDLAVLEGGPRDRPTVVLLHGYSADKGVWARFARHLTRDHHVVVPDLAGHGDTPFVPGAGYSAPAQADRVAGLLDALGVRRAHVLGNSMGGFVAAWTALRHPDRVLSAGLCDAAGVTAPHVVEGDRRREETGRPVFLLEDVAEFPAFYALTMARPPYVPGFVRAAMAQEYVDRRDQLSEIWDDFAGRDLLDERLGEITQPSLVLWGSQDQLVDPTAADVWADGLPDARLVTYPGVGHMPMVESPKQCATDYRVFVAEVERRSS